MTTETKQPQAVTTQPTVDVPKKPITLTTPSNKPKTPKQVREELNALGITLKDWAEANGYRAEQAYKIMSGERQGKYGIGHEIKVKLGLKIPIVAC